jgi:hypothetical protein
VGDLASPIDFFCGHGTEATEYTVAHPSEPVGPEELWGQSLQLMSGVNLCSSVPAGQGCIMIGCIE